MCQSSEGDVVETDDRHITRNRHACGATLLHHAEGHHVVCRDYRGWKRCPAAEYLAGDTPSAIKLKVTFENSERLNVRQHLRECITKGFEPLRCRTQAIRSTNIRDAFVA